ncbi:MAG: family 78 glycoside hydrolase catalytic domain, partial [Terracidiphilus sp.]
MTFNALFLKRTSACARGFISGAAVLWFAAALAHTTSIPGSRLLRPTDLRCEDKSEPLAVAEAHPEFSWQLAASSSKLHSVSQSAYRIQVTADGRGAQSPRAIVWDSGVVSSAATFGIDYTGPALEVGRAYAWHVEVWDEQKHASGWSEAGHWTEAPVWRAAWIAAHPADAVENEPLPLFRKSFMLTRPVARALLYASGLGQDELRINGRKVGSDELTPGWSDYRKTVYYDAYDVTALVRAGQNAMGVLLGNGMYRVLKTPDRYTKFVGSFGQLKCTVQLHIEFTDGSTADILSDGSWKTAPGPITFSSTYGGEDFDARLEPQGWDRAGFDDSQWRVVSVVDGPGGALTPEMAPPIRVMHTYAPVKVTQPKPGVTVYDLGQNFAGWPEIVVTGKAGTTLKLIPGELLDKDGLVSQRSSGHPQWFAYTLRGADSGRGAEVWHPRFSYYGFRYVQVDGAAGDDVHVVSLRGEAVHSSSQQVGTFTTSDELLDRIHLLILRAIENNAESIFTDCPHREKLGWLEETHLMAPSLFYDFDFAGLYAATARNIADVQRSDGPEAGMVPTTAPQYVIFEPKFAIFNDSPEWGSAAVLAPWYAYERTGDRAFLSGQYGVMRAYAKYLGSRAHDGIVDYGLGDWFDIGPGDAGFSKLTTAGVTGTAIYYQDLKALENTAAALGKSEDSEAYAEQAAHVRESFNARFFDAAQHRYDKGSQTAQAMPLALGMVPEDQRPAVLDVLVKDIRAHQNHTTCGEVGFHYEVDALLQGGRSDVLLDMLERTDAPSYGYILAQGATSLTEAWDGGHSQDHFMLGSAEEWFYRGLGGINVDLSQKDSIRLILHPVVVGKIQWARAHYRSALGEIESEWHRGTGETVYNFTIPANATATIEIDSAAAGMVTVNGVPPARAAGVLSRLIDGSRFVMTVGSGKYEVHAANPAELP